MVMCFMLASDAKEWLDNHRDQLVLQQEENTEKKRKEQEEVMFILLGAIGHVFIVYDTDRLITARFFFFQ